MCSSSNNNSDVALPTFQHEISTIIFQLTHVIETFTFTRDELHSEVIENLLELSKKWKSNNSPMKITIESIGHYAV